MSAIVETEFFFKMKWLVFALFVLVANDVVRTRNHTSCAAGAKTSIYDLFVELFPLVCPAFGNFDHFASLVSVPKILLIQVDMYLKKRQQWTHHVDIHPRGRSPQKRSAPVVERQLA
jgi:hypothetical protein